MKQLILKMDEKDKIIKKGRPRKWTEKKAMMLLEDLYDWMCADENNIYVETFFYIDIDHDKYPGKVYPSLINHLRKSFPAFDAQYTLSLEITKAKLKSLATLNKTNANFSKFILSAEYNYSEKSEKVVTLKNVPILNLDPLRDQ